MKKLYRSQQEAEYQGKKVTLDKPFRTPKEKKSLRYMSKTIKEIL